MGTVHPPGHYRHPYAHGLHHCMVDSEAEKAPAAKNSVEKDLSLRPTSTDLLWPFFEFQPYLRPGISSADLKPLAVEGTLYLYPGLQALFLSSFRIHTPQDPSIANRQDEQRHGPVLQPRGVPRRRRGRRVLRRGDGRGASAPRTGTRRFQRRGRRRRRRGSAQGMGNHRRVRFRRVVRS